jgi:hypothetical protein
MTVYILRYADDGETSHINEGFRSKADAYKRYSELKKKSKEHQKSYDDGPGTTFDYPPAENFDFPFENYLIKVIVNNTDDLIRVINKL